MSFIEQGLDPNKTTPPQARAAFDLLAKIILDSQTWGPWEKTGWVIGATRHTRSRELTRHRSIDSKFISEAIPAHTEPGWPGPAFTLAEGQGALDRIFSAKQTETSRLGWGWRRKHKLVGVTDYLFHFSTKQNAPQLEARSLTTEELAAYEPYGGASYRVVPEDWRQEINVQYNVTRTQDGLYVGETPEQQPLHIEGYYPSTATQNLARLIALNNLLLGEISMTA